jgi:amino acid transporter
MAFLDIFAIFCLAFMALTIIAIIVLMGMLPGHIAHQRRHPYATAVTIAGWVGLLFVVLWPLALVWAYVDVPRPPQASPELEELRHRVAMLEDAKHLREAAE